MGWVIGSFLDTGIGGKTEHAIKGSRVPEYERVEWKGKICVTNRGLYPSGRGGGLFVLALELLSSTGYVKKTLDFSGKIKFVGLPWGSNPKCEWRQVALVMDIYLSQSSRQSVHSDLEAVMESQPLGHKRSR